MTDMEDKILNMAFTETWRWERAINKAFDKGIPQALLREVCDPHFRARLYALIESGQYRIAPPHTAKIPKADPGEFRTVYINEGLDRVLLSLCNDLLFDLCPEMVHPACRSYQKGISCGNVVLDISRKIQMGYKGWKSDLSKYFDNVAIELIDQAFDDVERKHGKSALIQVLRDYYHQDLYFDENNQLQSKYQSLKQGCAVASWLADVILYPVDEVMYNRKDDNFNRYSDDAMYLSMSEERAAEAKEIFKKELEKRKLTLNPKKVEDVIPGRWVRFLGYSLNGTMISIGDIELHNFQEAIDNAVKGKTDYNSALHAVYRELYKGYNDYSWATRVLRVINVDRDINILNGYVMDALRTVITGKRKIGGLGYIKEQRGGCVAHGTGKNVRSNREKVPHLENYYTIMCMANALRTNRSAFDMIVRTEM